MTPTHAELARAVLDGRSVDWEAIDASNPDDHALVEQLRTLSRLREAARRPGAGEVHEDPWTWGHLQVLEPLGRGMFGEVHRAWDTRLAREVALKFITDGSAADPAGSSTIEEGRLLARVRHPNVVTVYGAERIDGRTGIWMELLQGRTLEATLDDGHIWTAREVARVGADLCRAVAAVHAAGLIHRDIKTQNVMLAVDGRVVLMDLGAGLDAEHTSPRVVTGTPLYLAPELLNGGGASAQSDVYGIGVVLYRLLTRAYPVEGRDLAQLRRHHDERGFDVAAAAARGIPRRLRHVLARAMDRTPAGRYQTVEAMGADLAAIAQPPWRRPAALAAAVLLTLVAGGLALTTGRGPTPAAVASTPAGGTAIAVLPFRNLSPEADSEYFVDGLTSDVIRNLAVIEGLQVRSQTSSFLFKGRARDLRAVGEQLGVGFVLEADVLRVGQRLRVNAQLARTADDVTVWSDTFDRALGDVFAIQDEISQSIVRALRLTLGSSPQRAQTNLPAYDLYLRGRALVIRGGTEHARLATQLFEQAVAADPAFGPAHAGLADAYAELSWQLGDGLPLDLALRSMRPAAARALDLDPLLAEAHAAMGITYAREREWVQAAASFERAISLNPSLTHIQANYALNTLLPTAQLARAERLLDAALTRDPLSPTLLRERAWTLFTAGRFDDAVVEFRRVLAIDPAVPFASQGLARALTFAGRPDEAIDVWARRPASDGDWERWLTPAYVRAGRNADVARIVDAHRQAHPYRQAIVYAAIGDRARTLETLSRAAVLSPHRTAQLLVMPETAFVRDAPELAGTRARLNLGVARQ